MIAARAPSSWINWEWINAAAARLTRRRVRVHALVLVFSLWTICAVDYATPGVLDRAGNIKFQDFIQFRAAARLISQGRAVQLYDDAAVDEEVHAIAGSTRVHLQYFYGPQVAVSFIPFRSLTFLQEAGGWAAFSLLIYLGGIYWLWKSCSSLRGHASVIALCAAAYPPVFHFFVRGQVSALVFAMFTGAYFAFRLGRDFAGGVVLGLLFFKPQFLVGLGLVLLISHAWNALAGLAGSVAVQAAFTWLSFGPVVTGAYVKMLIHSGAHPGSTELRYSTIQMHSLYSFFSLLVGWKPAVWILYALASAAVVGMAASVWRRSKSLNLRFSALILGSILLNPHFYIYDLLALAPALLLLGDWILAHFQHPATAALGVLVYLSFILPLFGPVANWTHLQLSVPTFAVLLWTIWRTSDRIIANAAQKLDSREPGVV